MSLQILLRRFRFTHLFASRLIWKSLLAAVPTLNYSPDGTMIATAGYDGHVYVLDAETLEDLTWWDASGEEVWSVRWSPDGQQLAVGSMEWLGVCMESGEVNLFAVTDS